MSAKKKINNTLENFDDLFVGEPKNIERNLQHLLPKAECLENKSIYLQILSQIAFTQTQKISNIRHLFVKTNERNFET